MGFPMTDEHCENLIEVADQDGDGCLDLKEFVNFVLYGVLQVDDTEVHSTLNCERKLLEGYPIKAWIAVILGTLIGAQELLGIYLYCLLFTYMFITLRQLKV